MIAFTASAIVNSLLIRHRDIDDFVFTLIIDYSILLSLSILVSVKSCYSRQ